MCWSHMQHEEEGDRHCSHQVQQEAYSQGMPAISAVSLAMLNAAGCQLDAIIHHHVFKASMS